MVSLKDRLSADLVAELIRRGSKFVVVLDSTDYIQILARAIRNLDEKMFNPRTVLMQSPGTMVDVTALHIDEITNVYYPPQGESNFMFDELGIIPFISQSTNMTSLDGVVDYMQMKSVLNMMNRHMDLNGDWSLWPAEADGTVKLQLRNNYDLVMIEYLPYLNPEAEKWGLYENEYRFVLEWAFAESNVQSAEAAMTAQGLGVSDKWDSIAKYWTDKRDKIENDFVDSTIITYIQ